MEFVSVAEARDRKGLRMVVVGGLPSPWGEAAKGILHVTKIPFCAVRMTPEQAAVEEWTGQVSAPIVVYEDEPPRTGWAEILLLAERLAPQPSLLPANAAERARVFGLSHEICGEQGLGWSRRLVGIHRGLSGEGGFVRPVAEYLAPKYGYHPEVAAGAQQRVIDLLGLLADTLRTQLAAGSRYYEGWSLTALDIYAATFMTLFAPLPPEQCPMPEALRATFGDIDDATRAALDPILLEHRDFVYAEHLELPVEL